MPAYPSGTVAFLFTDIEGSTRRWESHQQAMWRAVQRHFEILDEAIVKQGGVHFKTIGDAVQAAFPSVSGAIAAAADAQAALKTADWGDIGPLSVRMAIHVGEGTPRDGDYLAPALNRLARLIAAGCGGQILLTEAAKSLATALPAGFALRDLGRHRLRDLLEAEHVFQLTSPGLPTQFPPLRGLDSQPNNLPAQPTSLIGRESELAAVRDAIAGGARLVTLTGAGGTGKTRLAMQAAAELLDAFPDGVWFVPLAAVSDPTDVLGAIAAVLGVREAPGEPLSATLSAHVRTRQMLLLLDNLEQVVGAGPLLADLLHEAQKLVILATSREPLRLRAEREMPIEPLSLPTGGDEPSLATALAAPAVRLFMERAQSVKPSFALDASNVADVVAICRRLDGLPLAIELAAARIRILTPAALLARLDQRLTVLTGGARDLPERQQTLRAAIAWSHDLLAPQDRLLFARLAIFTGGCTFDLAERVCSAPDGDLDVFDGIDSLVQKSLVRQHDVAGDTRFSMLETIHEFARERLGELPEENVLRRAHADAYLAMADGANWDEFGEQAALLDRLEADHANLRQAISHFEALGATGLASRLRLTAALAHFWWVRGHFSEGRRALDSAIASVGDASVEDRASAVAGAALLAEAQWDLAHARALHEEALSLWRHAGNARGVARSLTGLGVIARHDGDLDSARALHQEALDVWRATGDAAGTAGAMLDLAVVSQLRGDLAHAEPLLRESLERFRQIRDIAGEALAHQTLGVVATTRGDLIEAIGPYNESLPRWRRLENQQMLAMDLANLGEARQLSGSLDEAEPFYREALALYMGLGDPTGEGVVKGLMGRLAFDRGKPAEAVGLLLEALRLCWGSGDRGATADILDSLAEAAATTGDHMWAAEILAAGDLLRAETGILRMAVLARRFAAVMDAVDNELTAQPADYIGTIQRALERVPTLRAG